MVERSSVSKFSLKDCKIEIQRDRPRSSINQWFYRILAFPLTFLQRIRTTYQLIKYGEFREPMAKSLCPMRKFSPLLSIFFSFKIVSDSSLVKAILRYPRKDPEEGLFHEKETAEVLVRVLQDMFPSDNIKADDYISACHKNFLRLYRQPMLKFIGPENIKKHGIALQEMAEAALDISVKEGQQVDAMHLSMIYTTSIISKLLLGHPGPWETYRKISAAIDCINKCALKKAWRRPLSQEEVQEYQESLAITRQAIETAISNQEKPIFGSLVDAFKEQLTDAQMKSNLFAFYFAGSETSAALLSYLLWQLGQHPEYQEEIFQEITESKGPLHEFANTLKSIDRLFTESIRLFCPVYIMVRRPAADLICKATNAEGAVVFQEKINKQEAILCSPTFSARDPEQYVQPDQFNPHRFETLPKVLPWLPFGDGQHACPGQWLAKAEISIFVALLVQKYKVVSSPAELGQKGYLTLKPSEEIQLTFIPRLFTKKQEADEIRF